MGKLNIAHHKSYHPYRRDNIERVRRDEEEAARQDAEQEGRVALADAEARLTLLRERAGIGGKGKGKEKADDVEGSKSVGLVSGNGTGIGTGKHINFFEDLEQQATITAIRATKKTAPSEAEKGVALAPSAKDLNPWYSDKARDRGKLAEDDKDERRQRDLRFKSINDPLTTITQQLAARTSSQSSSFSMNSRSRDNRLSRRSDQSPMPPPPPKQVDPTTARLNRESSEHERAVALIRRKKREMTGNETPSTVHGGVDEGYGDVYNKGAVEEAHAHRDRWRRKGW